MASGALDMSTAKIGAAVAGLVGLSWAFLISFKFGLCGVAYLVMTVSYTMWLKRVAWKRAALACLLAGVVAGVAATTLRATTGRPRPGKRYRYDLADSWTGPTLDDRYQSFPSGHTATSVGAAVAVCIVVPAATPLMALNATVMAGASLYDGKHYLTDVLVGSAFGVVLGVPIGVAARRRKCLFGEIG